MAFSFVGGEGIRHIFQAGVTNSYGYERLNADSNFNAQRSTHVMDTAQIREGALSKGRWKVSQSLAKLLLTGEPC